MLFTDIQDSDIVAARIAIEEAYNHREQLIEACQIACQTLKAIDDEAEGISKDKIKEILEDFNLENGTDFKNLEDFRKYLESYITDTNNILGVIDIVHGFYGEEKKE